MGRRPILRRRSQYVDWKSRKTSSTELQWLCLNGLNFLVSGQDGNPTSSSPAFLRPTCRVAVRDRVSFPGRRCELSGRQHLTSPNDRRESRFSTQDRCLGQRSTQRLVMDAHPLTSHRGSFIQTLCKTRVPTSDRGRGRKNGTRVLPEQGLPNPVTWQPSEPS